MTNKLKDILIVLLCLFVFGLALMPAHAQDAAVTATITDSEGTAFAGGTWKAEYVRNTGPGSGNRVILIPEGTPFSQWLVGGLLDATGSFSTTLRRTDYIAPTGGSWLFTICPLATTSCFSYSSGLTTANVNLSVGMSAAAGTIRVKTNPDIFNIIPRAYSSGQVSGAGIGSLYYDITGKVFRVWDGSAWQGIGTSFPILANPVGTAGAPAYSFAGDPDTGIYAQFGNHLQFATSGVGRVQFEGTAGMRLKSDFPVCWSNGSIDAGSETCMHRDAAYTIGFRNSTNAFMLRVYGTYIDANNWQRMNIGSPSANSYEISTDKLGSPGLPSLLLKASYQLYFTTNNTNRWFITQAGHFSGVADNTYDIGAESSSRPRTGYFGTSVVAPSICIGADCRSAWPTGGSTTITETRCARIGSDTGSVLVDADDEKDVWINDTGATITLTQIKCKSDSGTPTINVTKNGASNIPSANITCSTTGGTQAGFSSNTLANGDAIDIWTATAGGAAKRITVCWTGSRSL